MLNLDSTSNYGWEYSGMIKSPLDSLNFKKEGRKIRRFAAPEVKISALRIYL